HRQVIAGRSRKITWVARRSRLARYRAALDAGADPVEVTKWINEAEQERAQLEAELRSPTRSEPIGAEKIAELLERVGELARMAATADPDGKADLYRELGLRMTFHHDKKLVEARVTPDLHMYKGFVSEVRSALAWR
ncbi:hypothetical protein, partial [Actinomadura keratinilytica]|uniref:hypothetical protein n=1 Tax=Actinomadura keratinilytica TaxID=547461 RepID=UPI0031E74E4C